MNKKIVVVSSTPRINGNSEILSKEFIKGAKESGNDVTLISIRDLNLKFCIGCLYCQSNGKCVLKDDMNNLYNSISEADVLVFATPIYYYSICGQLKTFLDRLNPLFNKDNKFKEVYLLATAADDDEHAMDGAVKEIQGWVDCFEGVKLSGVVRGIGVTKAGEILNTKAINEVYEMGLKA